MTTITMPQKVYTCALETSDWMRDHGAVVERVVRRGYGYSVELQVPPDEVANLMWHVSTMADSLAGEFDCADDVRAMRAWLGKNNA
jgi:hypothetical protein